MAKFHGFDRGGIWILLFCQGTRIGSLKHILTIFSSVNLLIPELLISRTAVDVPVLLCESFWHSCRTESTIAPPVQALFHIPYHQHTFLAQESAYLHQKILRILTWSGVAGWFFLGRMLCICVTLRQIKSALALSLSFVFHSKLLSIAIALSSFSSNLSLQQVYLFEPIASDKLLKVASQIFSLPKSEKCVQLYPNEHFRC